MIRLERPVRRKVDKAARHTLVVSLVPSEALGGIIEVRELGRRKGFSIPLSNLYTLLAQREAERAIAERRAKRKARRA